MVSSTRAIVFRKPGPASVLELVQNFPLHQRGPGEVSYDLRVACAVCM